MLKLDEIKILENTARKLGADSYSGAWLADALPELESRIRSDFPIHPDEVLGPRKATTLAIAIVTEAREKAARLISEATAEADRITRTARERSQAERQTARQELRRMIDRIKDTV